MKKFQYLEIVKMEGNKVVKRFDVTGKGERGIERLERGVNINLNHNEFFTQENDSDVELTTDDKELEKEQDGKK
jgi:hypothetical protein